MNPTERYQKERARFHALVRRHDLSGPNIGLFLTDLQQLHGDLNREALESGERQPDSEHIKALKEAGIYPEDRAMVRYVDLRAKRAGFDPDTLFSAAIEWKARGFNPKNLTGICDWAEFGIESARSYPGKS